MNELLYLDLLKQTSLESQSVNCPTCHQSFDQETYEGVTIDVCSKCKGVWLDRSEVDQILKNRKNGFKSSEVVSVNRLCGSTGVAKEEESRQLNCPKCTNSPMKTFNYNYSSGIIVDRCSKGCGVWLDADELEKIQIHYELWQDKLEVNRDRFTILAGQVEENMGQTLEAINQAMAPSRFHFINSMIRGLVKFD